MAGAHTLPKDFAFFSPSESEPKTPDRPLRDLPNPPRPQHASHRVRRQRIERKPIPFCAPDVPLPSIELSRIPVESTGEQLQSITASMLGGFLEVPRRERTDPKTPPAQIRGLGLSELEGDADGTTTPVGASISRPSSACSNASDSSLSSAASFDSFASLGGSCTSPETEIDDPFLAVALPDNKHNLDTPSKSVKNSVVPPHLNQSHRWSSEMDCHLWNTYQTHLQDPTITPFKMLPGSLPPLGVSHRVAREARRAWLRVKQPQPPSQSQSQSQSQPSDSADSASRPIQWPRSDAATRRRLKELCKRKYSIAPHYQRLLQSRSPSPPPDMFSNYTTAATPAPFTRDLGISLVSGTLPSDPPEAASTPNIVSNTVHPITATDDDIPRLGSPFMYHTWGPSTSRNRVTQADTTPVQGGVEAHDTVHVTGSRLRSGMPPDLFTPNNQHLPAVPVPGPADAKENTPHRVRIRTRTRGLTTNSSSSSNMLNINSRHRLIQLFTPPSGSGSASNEMDDPASHGRSQGLEAEGEGIKRLGSPFNLDLPASKRPQQQPRQYHRPRHAPSRSDTFLMHPHAHTQGQLHFSNLSSTADIDTSDTERPAPATTLNSPAA